MSGVFPHLSSGVKNSNDKCNNRCKSVESVLLLFAVNWTYFHLLLDWII
jgi:hypothetical protein